jgi:hypothetical protein
MLRRLAAGVSAALLVASCSAGEPAASSSSTTATTTTVTTTSSPATAPVTSTTEPPTTSTAPVPPVLPRALGRDEIPWEQVGPGWYVVLFDSSPAAMDSAEWRDGPVGLYLVDREGRRYLVATWPADDKPQAIVDAAGTSVLVSGRPSMDADFQVEWVDLVTGERRMAGTADFPMRVLSQALFPRLVLPAGEAVTVYQSDGTTEWLERRSPDGESLGVFFEQAYVASPSDLRWLDRADGASVLVFHRGGASEVTPSGDLLGGLWVPAETVCYPVRWWDADTYLAACYGLTPASAPLDDYGNLHTYYGRLWLLETDGSAGAPLTAFPAEPPFVGDYGYRDAWPVGTETLIQWSGDCGAAAIRVLQPDGSGELLPVEAPVEVTGVEMVDVVGGVIAALGWQGCDGWVGSLFTVDLAGHFVRDLFPVVDGARGVFAVRGLAAILP